MQGDKSNNEDLELLEDKEPINTKKNKISAVAENSYTKEILTPAGTFL